MADIAKINASNASVGLIEENLNVAPEWKEFPAMQIAGTSFDSLIRTALPTSQFRQVNTGVAPTKSTLAVRRAECAYFDVQLEMDTAVADACAQGADYALTLEANGAMQSAMLKVGAQIWYGVGTGGDANGFQGAVSVVDSSLVTDAGGTTASTGSSVYGVKLGTTQAQFIFGRNRGLTINPWRQQSITRSSLELTAWKNSIEGWLGVQWVNKYAVSRIKKLTEDSGKGLTDALIANMVRKCPVGHKPDALFMSRRSAWQLQVSRSAVSSALTGSAALAFSPQPVESNGIRIVVTDSISDTESLSL